MATLLEEVGGRPAIEGIVAEFHGRVLSDSRLAPFFRGVSMTRLQNHETDFLCAALGGGYVYRGRDMMAAHAGMQITDEDFDRVLGHLRSSLAEAALPISIVDEILALIAPLRSHIVEYRLADAACAQR